jgi:predicted ATPase/DNA-binding CsgD family transcriptional regulator
VRHRSLERRGGRLPAELTSMVGRKQELAEIRRLFGQGRLVTLIGPGGVGKTRLAVRAAAELRSGFADGVCFVDLATLREPGLLTATVCDMLGLADQGWADPADRLADHLADLHLLLILDNCEHLVDACAIMSEVLLRAAPRLSILVTSRQSLDLIGEYLLVVEPLARPEPGRTANLAACESVQLFAQRAAAVAAGWTLNPANQDAVALLCRRLDGIPLAIELAAVQVRALPVDQILAHLDQRLLRLRGRRTGLARHQTLHAAVAWSHELCTPEERLLWTRLAAFSGCFDLDTVKWICADERLPEAEIVDTLAGLVGKSIVLRAERGYWMLETLRQFGAERLAQQGECAALKTRALEWYAAKLRESRAALVTSAQVGWLDWFRREQPNLRALYDHALRTADDEVLITVGAALARFWTIRGQVDEACYWIDRVLESRASAGPEWGEVLSLAALALTMHNEFDRAARLLDSIEPPAEATVLGYATMVRGLLAMQTGDLTGALRHFCVARDLYRESGTADIYARMTDALAAMARVLGGDLDGGGELVEELVRECAARGELWSGSYAWIIMAGIHLLHDAAEEALECARAALRVKRDIDDSIGLGMALDVTGAGLTVLGDQVAAARAWGGADQARSRVGAILFGPRYVALLERFRGQCAAALGVQCYAREHGVGLAADLHDLVDTLLGDAGSGLAEAGETRRHPLTPRELEIAGLLAEGLTNREIAERLVIAKRTVDAHVEHILTKLGFSSRTQVATWFVHLEEATGP